jgi:diguanylate cyclase (GGDEF)-like protein
LTPANSASNGAGEDPRIGVVIHNVTFVGIFAHAAFVGVFWWLHVPAMALFNVGSVICWIVARIAGDRRRTRLAVLLIVGEVVSHAVLAVLLMGWRSGFQYYLLPLIPFLMFNGQLSRRVVVAASVGITLILLALQVATVDAAAGGLAPATLHALELLNIVVPLTALALISFYYRLASVEVERRMEALAMTDALTRLPNRRYIRELLESERVSALHSGRGFGVIIADIDGFKSINDTRGHDGGDHVLREVAAVLRGALRANDSAARWGGEEFLFLLPDTDLAGAGAVAEKLRVAVENAALSFADQPLPVTLTFGVAVCSGAGSIDESVRRADRALYRGKSLGKNRVVMDEGEAG